MPEPDDPRKPQRPADLRPASRRFVLRSTAREFLADECTDAAAALTYFGVLSLFPAALALVSLLGVLAPGQQSVQLLVGILRDLRAGSAVDTVEPVLRELAASPAAGLALLVGVLGAVWSASGYVNAFGRAMNRIYEVREGRPVWKLRPQMLLVTAGLLLLVAASTTMLVVSGPLAQAVGGALGLGGTVLTVWEVAKWPVLLTVVVLMVALLYHVTPNVRQPRFRWVSVGALVAILVWAASSAAFGVYVANFGSYDQTYGSLAGAIVFLLWLWITNLALLFGAELDAELERARELQAGLGAEEAIQLPPRETTKTDKDAAKEASHVAQARELRETTGGEA